MAIRKEHLITGEVYHIYNRGAGKQDIFVDDIDSWRFLTSMISFNNHESVEFYSDFPKELGGSSLPILVSDSPYVEIYAYALNPNHYHLLIKQLVDDGISKYMQKLSSGYTTYMNRKYEDKSGSLFQGVFKVKRVTSDEYFQLLLAYIHMNDKIHSLNIQKDKRIRNSFSELINKQMFKLCSHSFIRSRFKNVSEFVNYANDTVNNIVKSRKKENTDATLESLLID